MFNCKQRFWCSIVAVTAMGAIGAGAGFVVARELALKDALARLASDAASGLQTADSYAGFTRKSISAVESDSTSNTTNGSTVSAAGAGASRSTSRSG